MLTMATTWGRHGHTLKCDHCKLIDIDYVGSLVHFDGMSILEAVGTKCPTGNSRPRFTKLEVNSQFNILIEN